MRVCTFLQYPSTSIEVGIAGFADFDTVIKHSIVTHSGNTLKYQRPLIHLSSVHKCKLTGGGHLAAILVIGQSPYSNLGESLIKVIYI